MNKLLINFLKFAASLAIGIGLIYWSLGKFNESQKEQILEAFKDADYKWLILLILVGFLSNFSRTKRWILLLRSINYDPSFANTFFAVTLMFFANLFFPRLGEISRCTILAKYEKVPIEKSIGTMVLERIIDLFSILTLGIILLFVENERLYKIFRDTFEVISNKLHIGATIQYVIFFAIFICIIVIYISNRNGLFSTTYFDKVKEKLTGLWQGVISIKNLTQKWEFLFHTVFIWVCYILMPYFGFKCLTETFDLGITAAIACVFFGGFAMVLTQGGIGAFPITIQKVLSLYAINNIIGLSYGWISWSAQTISVIIGGVLSLMLLMVLNKKSQNIQ